MKCKSSCYLIVFLLINIFWMTGCLSTTFSRGNVEQKTEKTTEVADEIIDKPIKVILDCDMGYMNDDMLALSMLLKAEEKGLVDILGITLVGGNVFIDAPYVNNGEELLGSAEYTKKFLEEVKRSDIPIKRGTDFPLDINKDEIDELDSFYQSLNYIKWHDNYGAIHFFTSVDSTFFCDSEEAVNFMTKSVRDNPGEVVIFAIGPTTNVAKSVMKDSDFAPNVKAIYCMGGALGESCEMETVNSEKVEGITDANVTPETEYNVLCDPVAFKIFTTAPFAHRFLLPGSCNVDIDEDVAKKIIEEANKSGGNEIIKLWANHYIDYIQDYPYWDPLTVYALLNPESVAKSSVEYITVDSDRNSKSFGRTISVSSDEYNKLTDEQKAKYGKTDVIYEMEGFWDYTIDLFVK